jgi:uncharacterized tellurite resistance protein B-like protein
MDAILGFIVLILILGGFNFAMRVVFGGLSAAGRTLTKGGSFKENFKVNVFGMDGFQIRGLEKNLLEDNSHLKVLEIQCKGLLPLKKKTNLAFCTSIFDVTDGDEELAPVISALDDFQEPNSRVFQHVVNVGKVNEGVGFVDWVRVAAVIPDILVPPTSGQRKLKALIRLINSDNPPPIHAGFSQESNHPGTVAMYQHEFTHNFTEKGYLEAKAHKAEATALMIMLGIQVAMSDGSLAEQEGNVIKEWISKTISTYTGDEKERLKKKYNEALKEGYEKAQSGSLSISAITSKLNDLATTSQKYEAIELCYDVMAADGVAEEQELKSIRNIAQSLNLDFEEIQKMKDLRVVKLSTSVTSATSAEEMLGIDPEWSEDQIQQHLKSEFRKWNGRLNTLSAGEERDNAQRMLNLIAEARKKYAQAA